LLDNEDKILTTHFSCSDILKYLRTPEHNLLIIDLFENFKNLIFANFVT